MKKIKKTFFYLFGFAFLLFAFTVIINLSVFDEELLPEVQAIKDIKATPYGEDNAYPALLALNTPHGPTLTQATQTIRDHLNLQISKNGEDYLNKEDYNRLIGNSIINEHDRSWSNKYYQCRSRTDKDCMASLIEDVTNNPISDKRLIDQLKRYSNLIEMTSYQGATQIDITAPYVAFGSTQALKRLFLAEAYVNQPIEGYLNSWTQDVNFWRMVLSKSNLLITKMVTIAAVRNSIDSLSTAIRLGALNPHELREFQSHLKTLSIEELDMSPVFKYEFKYGMSMIDSVEQEEPIGITSMVNFYQPQATHNTNYTHVFKPLQQVSKLSTPAYYQHITGNAKVVEFISPFSMSLSTLYNPVGKQLVGYAIPAYNDYIGRGHDLNGMFYLLKLQIEIALNPDISVEQVIVQSQYTNPYTLEPMSYNKDSHSIYFECIDKHSVCELSI